MQYHNTLVIISVMICIVVPLDSVVVACIAVINITVIIIVMGIIGGHSVARTIVRHMLGFITVGIDLQFHFGAMHALEMHLCDLRCISS